MPRAGSVPKGLPVPYEKRTAGLALREGKTDSGKTDIALVRETRPPWRRSDVISFALVGLLVISIGAVLYVGRAFFLPLVTAFVVGTMLSPAAKFMEKYNIPRSVSAVVIVATACAGLSFMIALISAPMMDWMARLPELAVTLKAKLHVFDRPLALLYQLEEMLGWQRSTDTAFTLPKIEWVKPTVEYVSPTLTEILLFFAVLILFIASWPSLRKALIFNFAGHEQRLRTLRILNAIETSLGSYLATVTMINFCLGIITGLLCALSGMPNPAGMGALAAVLNFIPIIGPVVMFVIMLAVGIISFSTLSAGLLAPLCFAGLVFLEGHFITPSIVGRRLQLNALAVFVALAFWSWLWGPMGAFLSSPLLIVGLVLKEHLMPDSDQPTLPEFDEAA